MCSASTDPNEDGQWSQGLVSAVRDNYQQSSFVRIPFRDIPDNGELYSMEVVFQKKLALINQYSDSQ